MVYRLTIPRATPSQNSTDRSHWRKRYDLKSEWWWLIRAADGFLKITRATGKRRLTIERHARGIPQDPANVIGGTKGIVDDLVDLGILINDTQATVDTERPSMSR